jgi:hypothetical protein
MLESWGGRLGDLEEAEARYREALGHARARGDDLSTGHILGNLALTARLRGAAFLDSLDVFAELMLSQDRIEDAVGLLGHVAAVREAGRFAVGDGRQEERELRLQRIRMSLGEQRFAIAWARGRARSSAEVLAWVEQAM